MIVVATVGEYCQPRRGFFPIVEIQGRYKASQPAGEEQRGATPVKLTREKTFSYWLEQRVDIVQICQATTP